jgi:hypothetical protein
MGNQRVAASRAVDTFKEIARAIVRPTVVASQRERNLCDYLGEEPNERGNHAPYVLLLCFVVIVVCGLKLMRSADTDYGPYAQGCQNHY